MAKDKKTMVLDKYAQGMFLRQEQYALRVQSFYDQAVTDLLDLAAQVKNQYGDKAFRFSDNPRIKNETTQVIRKLYTQVYAQIKSGVETEWELANASCDALVGSCFNWKNSEEHFFARLFERNRQAMEQFFQRKSVMGGLNLSQKVWKYTSDLRTEMENAITVSLGEGVSAATMSRRVRQYLREPDRLYRRVRGADGKLHLSKNAKAFHPGAGVYRSSYKNAMRLTRTETNAAYRLAEEDRWQRMPFVVGIRIKKSNNHPSYDVCDLLCGDYPKDFKFSAFHPQCRCYVTPILCTPEELARYNKNILQGKSNDGFKSVNEVKTTPKAFNDWVYANRERIRNAAARPYFIRDNKKYSDRLLISSEERKTAILTAQKKRWANRDVQKIQSDWNLKRLKDRGYTSLIDSITEAIDVYGVNSGRWREFLAEKLEIDKATNRVLGTGKLRSYYYDKKREVEIRYNMHLQPLINLRNSIAFENVGARGNALLRTIDRQIAELEGNYKFVASYEGMKDVKNKFLAAKSALAKIKQIRDNILDALRLRRKQGYTPHKALRTSYSNTSQVDKTFAKINAEFKAGEDKWFENGNLTLELETNPRNNGSTDRRGNIWLTRDRLDSVRSALGKIGSGKAGSIIRDEADAMATFWHEITHNMHKKLDRLSSDITRKNMELANEYVARRTLHEFYGKLGVKSMPFPEFSRYRYSTGYDTMVCNYRYVIEKLKLDESKVLATVRNHLLNEDYDTQIDGLIQGLIDGGMVRLNGKKATKLHELMVIVRDREYSAEMYIDRWLQKNGYIQ